MNTFKVLIKNYNKMESLFIILQHQQSLGERVAIGFLTGLFFTILIAISNGVRNAKQRNKKDFDEVSKNETNTNHTSDWNDDK